MGRGRRFLFLFPIFFSVVFEGKKMGGGREFLFLFPFFCALVFKGEENGRRSRIPVFPSSGVGVKDI